MFIFDNILFASFIPQVLMFLGFVHCMVAPFITADRYNVEDESLHRFEIQVKNEDLSSLDNDSVVYFSSLDYEVIVTDNEFLQLADNTTTELLSPDNYFESETYLPFSLFSRPPPTIS